MNRSHEELRKELWIKVAVAVAASSNSTQSRACSDWANAVLNDFDKKFPTPQKKEDEA